MPDRPEPTRWQRFCAAMVEYGHGRTCDISAMSAQRRAQPQRGSEPRPRSSAAPETEEVDDQSTLFT